MVMNAAGAWDMLKMDGRLVVSFHKMLSWFGVLGIMFSRDAEDELNLEYGVNSSLFGFRNVRTKDWDLRVFMMCKGYFFFLFCKLSMV